MMKFDNKLELRFYFNDKSNYMDAMIKHRAEKEVLTLLRSLADMLDIKMTIYSESYQYDEGFREIWSVAGENSRLISILLNLFMQIWTRPSLSVEGAPVMFFTMENEEHLQQEIASIRLNLKKKQQGITVSRDFVKLMSASPRICKNKSNFYEVVSPIKDNKATIEIISPVLSDARFRWKGIYNKGGETIDFYMSDDEFKKDMFDEKIVFKSGMCIDCILEIQRKMNELGKVVNISYTVITVIRTRFDKMEILTPQGKRYLRKLEAEKKQLTLDFFG